MSRENLDFTSKIMAWCQDNLKYLIIGALIGIIIPLSWNYYKHLRTIENLVASDLYGELVNLIDLLISLTGWVGIKNLEVNINQHQVFLILHQFLI